MWKIDHNSINLYQIPTKIDLQMHFNEPFMCTKFQLDRSRRSQVMVENVKCAKRQRKNKKLCLLVFHDWLAWLASNLVCRSPSLVALLQQIWLNLGKRSQSYIGGKITFFVFLSIYSWCNATASWATWHTTVRLDFACMLPFAITMFLTWLCHCWHKLHTCTYNVCVTVFCLFQNLLEKPEKAAADLYASQMIHFKALRVSARCYLV